MLFVFAKVHYDPCAVYNLLLLNCIKQLKSLESQLEEEYAEKQAATKEKRELERKLKELNELEPEINRGKLRFFCLFVQILCSVSTFVHDALFLILVMNYRCRTKIETKFKEDKSFTT